MAQLLRHRGVDVSLGWLTPHANHAGGLVQQEHPMEVPGAREVQLPPVDGNCIHTAQDDLEGGGCDGLPVNKNLYLTLANELLCRGLLHAHLLGQEGVKPHGQAEAE